MKISSESYEYIENTFPTIKEAAIKAIYSLLVEKSKDFKYY